MKAHLITNVQAFTVQVINRGKWVSLTEFRYVVAPNQPLTIPVEFLDGSDPSCVNVTNADQVTSTGITLTSVSADTVITITDVKSKVTLVNGDPKSISAITPASQFVADGSDATFTLMFNSGFDSSYIQADRNASLVSISGNTVTVNAASHETTASLTAKQYTIIFQNRAPWVLNADRSYYVRKGNTFTIPIGYMEDADYTTITANNGTPNSNGVTISNVSSDMTCRLDMAKGQVNYEVNTAIFSSLYPTYSYATPGSDAQFNFSLYSGYSSSAISLSEGYVSGSSIYVPVDSTGKKTITISDNLPKITIGAVEDHFGSVPLNDSYGYSISEQIYKASEIGRSGKIVQIGFMTNMVKTRSLEIYVSTTSIESMDNNWISMYSSNMVFSGSVTFKNGWTFINLTNPYTYNSSSNLVLCVNDVTGRQTYDLKFVTHNSGFESTTQQSNYWNRYYPSNNYSYYGLGERSTIQLVFAN